MMPDMKIIITGSESFVGKELISQLRSKNVKIIGFDYASSEHSEYEFHKVDIRDPQIHQLIPEDADALIHLAALSRDADCKKKAFECFDVNVMGTLNLIKAASAKRIKQFIFASSEWVYDEFKVNEEKDEDSYINAANLDSEYALSKLVSEINLRQQYKNGFCNTTILRFGIIYGPRKNNWSAVESIFSGVKNKPEITIGSLHTGRRFVHVSDIARGIIMSIGLKGFNIINLTSNKIITLQDIIETSQKILNKTSRIIETNPSQISLRNPSNNKAKKILDWEPKMDLETGLRTLLNYV
ncbi:MAG: NAD(P)-dependent oxidoreductase [Nitrosopumilales archaeon]|nr:MAG: NAD(P)-dependent oxidoreductase [Nitrosopumilales archaeon]